MQKKLDRRVRRTRRLLAEALISLIHEQSYDAISITDITERADLNRATFYLHYDSKETLLMDLLKSRFDKLVTEMEGLHPNAPQWYTHEADTLIFEHVAQHAQMYQVLLSVGPVIRYVLTYIAHYIEKDLHEWLNEHELVGGIPIAITAQHVAGSMLAQLIWWLDAGMPYPPEEMARMVHAICLQGTLPHMGEHRENVQIT